MKFTKNDTLAVKGIAILLMMQHHCFRTASLFDGYSISFYPFSGNTVIVLSNFMKICVGMFVFLSAYGLTFSLKKYNANTVINSKQYTSYLYPRLIKLMWGYWFIFIVAQIGCIFIGQRQLDTYLQNGIARGIYKFAVDFFGLSNLFGTASLNNTWWYMTLAVLIVLVVPFVAKALKKYSIFTVMLVTLFLPRVIQFATSYKIGENNSCLRWSFAIILGVIFAQYNVLVKMKEFMITKNKYLSKTIKFLLATVVLIAMVYMRIRYNKSFANFSFEFNDGIVPVFVIYYCYEFIIGIPVLRQVLCFLGKHSMNIFLFHTFIRHYWFEDFTYSFHHFALVSLVLLLTSLVASIIFEFIKKLIHYDDLMNTVIKKIQEKFIKESSC
jgi:hypothetical protein